MGDTKNYRWDAEEYAKHSTAQHKWARELLGKLDLQGNETVLDIGCGDGKITAEIAALLPQGHVVGVDSSKAMLSLASARHAGRFDNVSFDHGDARCLSYKERFDIVFSNAALHWVKDHRPVLAGIHQGLKDGGRVLIQMGGEGNAETVLSLFKTLIQEKKWTPYFQNFTFPYGFYGADCYKNLLQEADLSPIRVELIPKDMLYPDMAGFAGWLRTTWLPYMERIPSSLQETFITTLVRRYMEQHSGNNKGIICVPMVRLEVEATK